MIDRDRDDDEELREHFFALRREEEALTPRFGIASRASRRDHSRSWTGGRLLGAFVCVAAVCAAIIATQILPRPESRVSVAAPEQASSLPVAAITEWRPPTDFLLNTPGRAVLRTVPWIEGPSYMDLKPIRRRSGPRVATRISP